MKPRLARALLVLLGLACLIFALRHDLGELALRRGETRLRAGDIVGAKAALDQAIALGGDGAPLAYNLGVDQYRKGDFAQAMKLFDAAKTSDIPGLRAAALYNQGNSEFRLAERLSATRPEAAMDAYRKAVTQYDEAWLQAAAADVSSNRALSMDKLAALAQAQKEALGRLAGKQPPPSRESGGNGLGKGTEASRPHKDSRQAGTGELRRADAPAPSATAGKSRRELTRAEAERLLNDARGREQPMGMPHVHKQAGPLAQPDLDW